MPVRDRRGRIRHDVREEYAECNLTPSQSTASATPTVAVVVVVVAMAFGTALSHLFPVSTTSFVAWIRPTVDWEAMWADVLLGRTVAEYLDEVYVYGSVGAGAAALMLLSWLVLLVMHCCLAVATRKLGCAVMCCDAQRGCCPATAATIDTAAEAEAEAARGGGGSTRKLDGTMWVATAAGLLLGAALVAVECAAQIRSARNSVGAQFGRRAILSARNSRRAILGAIL